MENWFEKNQTKSVITYTSLVIAASWAFYKYTFEERKLDLYKAQIETKQSEISAQKTRIEFLETENQKLDAALKEYEDWNMKSSNPELFYKNKFEETALLKKIYEKSIALNGSGSNTANTNGSGSIYGPASVSPKASELPLEVTISKGNTYIDDKNKIVIALNDVRYDDECDIIISVGNIKNEIHKNVKTGRSFYYKSGDKKISIILKRQEFINSSAKFYIQEEK